MPSNLQQIAGLWMVMTKFKKKFPSYKKKKKSRYSKKKRYSTKKRHSYKK